MQRENDLKQGSPRTSRAGSGLLYRLWNGYRSGVMGGSLWVTLMKRCFTTLWKSQFFVVFVSIIITHPKVE